MTVDDNDDDIDTSRNISRTLITISTYPQHMQSRA